MLKTVMIIALVVVKMSTELNFLRITPRAMQVTAVSVTFLPVFGVYSVWSSHPFGLTIALRSSENEFLCSVAVIRECLAIAKGREQ